MRLLLLLGLCTLLGYAVIRAAPCRHEMLKPNISLGNFCQKDITLELQARPEQLKDLRNYIKIAFPKQSIFHKLLDWLRSTRLYRLLALQRDKKHDKSAALEVMNMNCELLRQRGQKQNLTELLQQRPAAMRRNIAVRWLPWDTLKAERILMKKRRLWLRKQRKAMLQEAHDTLVSIGMHKRNNTDNKHCSKKQRNSMHDDNILPHGDKSKCVNQTEI